MSTTSELRWGWVSEFKDNAPQTETFQSPDKAIEAMHKRLGDAFSVEELAERGFSLALLRVTVEPVMVLRSVDAEMPSADKGT